MAIPESKVCAGCGRDKPASDFFVTVDKRGAGARYLSARCKPCHYAKSHANRCKRRERDGFNRHHVQATYGVTAEQYNEMLERQGGVCAICRREETRAQGLSVSALSVDHDHETGRVRGLLCSRCNAALGLFDHDPAMLAAAIDYLGVGGPSTGAATMSGVNFTAEREDA